MNVCVTKLKYFNLAKCILINNEQCKKTCISFVNKNYKWPIFWNNLYLGGNVLILLYEGEREKKVDFHFLQSYNFLFFTTVMK